MYHTNHYGSRYGGYADDTDHYDDQYRAHHHQGGYAEEADPYAKSYRTHIIAPRTRNPEETYKYRTHNRRDQVDTNKHRTYIMAPRTRNPEETYKYRTHNRRDQVDTNKHRTYVMEPRTCNPEETYKYRRHNRREIEDTNKYRSHRTRDQGNQGNQSGAIKYKKINTIGAGGQGECVLVERSSDRKLLVLKIIRNPLLTRGVPCEVRVLKDVLPPCPLIIKFHQAILQQPETHLFFDYCDGGDLHSLIDNYTLHQSVIPEAFVWHVFVQLAQALAFIHYGVNPSERHAPSRWNKVIHRDIKPANIFLKSRSGGKYPHVILGDFGLAAVATDPDYNSISHNGTPSWRAPELPEATARSDVWSLAAIIHAMAHHGRSPLKSMPKTWPNDRRNRERWEADPEVRAPWKIDHLYSSTLQKWMMAGLEPNPGRRTSSLDLVKQMMPEGERRSRDSFKALKSWVFDLQQ
ncbi:MAG: hypothetical protein Q9187_008980 [Circinaria calcarea]